MKVKIVLLLLSSLMLVFSAFFQGARRSTASQIALADLEAQTVAMLSEPIARLKVPGRSATRLANPVLLPFERQLPGPITDWMLMTADGQSGREYYLNVRPLDTRGFRYAQRSGRSSNGLKAWWMLANRRTGQGLALALAYMGNWTFEVVPHGHGVAVRLDTSPRGLMPFATINGLPIPGALVAEFTGHWDYGAQPITRFIRERLQRDQGEAWPPVQYNTWYDQYEKFTQGQIYREARAAAAVGCELFTVDAGWFGAGLETDWNGSLGDWQVNRDRLPDGLEAVSGEVHRLGMKFGLWFEIECANSSSSLALAHPDWFLTDARGRRISRRDVLDFGNPEVLAHAKQVIGGMVERCRLDYIKMDFNIDLAINNQHLAPEADPLYRHYRGLAGLWTWMREQYPSLIIENCASGSLRQELTAAAYTDTHWVSDQVDNQPNLMMMLGATYLFPAATCSHWTAAPDSKNDAVDLDAQFVVNMMGHMGLSGAIAKWDERTLEAARTRIAQYKKLRPLLRQADVFHLTGQCQGAMQAAFYVDRAADHGLLFAFQGGDPAMQRAFKMRGIDPARQYRVSVLGVGPEDAATAQLELGLEETIAGRELLEQGLNVTFPKPGAAVVIELKAEPLPTLVAAHGKYKNNLLPH